MDGSVTITGDALRMIPQTMRANLRMGPNLLVVLFFKVHRTDGHFLLCSEEKEQSDQFPPSGPP